MDLFKKTSGFTLVETLVSLGLLGGLAFWGMQSFDFQTKATKTVELRNEYEYILKDLREILSVSEACEANFKDWVVPSAVNTGPCVSKNITYIEKTGAAPVTRYIMSVNPASAPKYGNKSIKLLGLKLTPDLSS